VTFGGTGSTKLSGGSGTLSGTVTANNFEFAAGTLGGTAQVNGTGFNWTGGTFSGGTLTMNAGSVLTIGGAAGKTLSGYTLANAGTVNWTSSNNLLFENGAVIRQQRAVRREDRRRPAAHDRCDARIHQRWAPCARAQGTGRHGESG
jgi:hypothetical protein